MAVSATGNPFEYHQQLLTKKAAKGLYIGGLFALALVSIWFLNEGNWEFDGKTLWGITIMSLASYPSLMWAKRSEKWLPIFEVSTLMAIPQYALPLLSHPLELRFYPDATISKGALLIAIHTFISILGFSIFRRPARVKKILLTSLIPSKFYYLGHVGLFISNIYLFTTTFYSIIPSGLERILGALFLGLSTLSIFITSHLWGLKLLNPSRKLLFIINIALNTLMSFLGLYLIMGFATVFLAILSYSSARKQIPWTVLSVFVFIISILHLGKAEMRGKYWSSSGTGRATQSYRLKVHEVPSFFSEWINDGLKMERASKYSNIDQTSSLERASLFPMVCLAVDRIPREKGYLMGSSYTGIATLLIPRALLPNKASVLAANDELMIHLGLVNPDNITVNIALGLPTEAYVNFGFIGVGILGLLLGAVYKNISLLSQNSPQFSVVGIFSILLLSSTAQSGQNAAVWVSTLFQMSVICIGAPLLYKTINSSPLSSK